MKQFIDIITKKFWTEHFDGTDIDLLVFLEQFHSKLTFKNLDDIERVYYMLLMINNEKIGYVFISNKTLWVKPYNMIENNILFYTILEKYNLIDDELSINIQRMLLEVI